MVKSTRRQFAAWMAAAAAAEVTRSLWARATPVDPTGRKFYIALIADTHIIDSFYVKGSENGVEDNESILHTSERLTAARERINSLTPGVDKVFVLGDYFHNYPSPDYEFYFKNRTRIDNAKELTDGFRMPVHLVFGNHDYAVKTVPREMSHRLFAAKLGAKPYAVIDHKGCRFITANNFLGSTQDRNATDFDPKLGSFGLEQLEWLDAQLAARKPTYVFLHFPVAGVQPTERKDFGFHPLLRKYQDSIQLVVTGHLHRWIDHGREFGPQHVVMAATRYDPNAEMFLEIDTQTGGWRWLNRDWVEWSTHFAKPYDPVRGS